MKPGHGMAIMALVLMSGGSGWLLRGLRAPDAAAPVAVQPAASAAEPTASALSILAYPPAREPDAVTLHADGRVSLRVGRRAPDWVLEELCRQGARMPACEQVRPQALQQSRSKPAPMTEAELMQLMKSGSPEQVQLQALEQLVKLKSRDPDELRTALQAVLYIRNTVLQTRAREYLDRLDELRQTEEALRHPGS